MKSSEVPTVKAKRSPVILVVGFGADFVRRCDAAATGTEATIVGIEAGAESAFTMQTLPLAVVMQRESIRTSPLATIARELGIGLIAVPGEDVTDARLKELFEGAMAASQARSRPSR
ncbi:Hypothetical protein A7982_07221 [Minicystis rosea]|nr:Hypothetical protein A7982_07221 [Minicystis rosea]